MKEVENDELHESLEFLEFNIDKLPKFIKEATIPKFNISRANNDKDLKIYKYVPIDQIEILLTPTLRSDDIKKKYSEALPLRFFLNQNGDEEETALFKTFSKMARNMSVSEIEKIEKMQEEFCCEEPFKVKYNRDHLWQIYYSEEDDKYFMLVCTKEQTFSEFFYLLKAQIKHSKKRVKNSPKIYVPINYMGYSEQILAKNEITDLENYVWLFTKNWPLIFEVYNTNNEVSLKIVGETFVYKNIKSNYKVVLNSTEEALKFYKLLKALFILQTEIKGQYAFETRIDTNNNLNMYLSKVEITYESLTNFIKNEFLLADYEIKNQNQKIAECKEVLSDLKIKVKQKEDEYLQKQKEISTYLECKKTFIGKVKYFFKSAKKQQSDEKQEENEVFEKEILNISTEPLNEMIGEKEFYTIEDLVTIHSLYERAQKNYKDIKQDIKALELKFENLISKVRNANLYIEEIGKHKKSIFEFWKFANKDEKLALEMGDEGNNDKDQSSVKKAFDLEMDFEKLGEEADKIQRKKMSNQENDSIFITQTELLDFINMARLGKIDKLALENILLVLKEEFEEDRLVIDAEAFDIFGSMSESSNKIKYIGSKSHRENEKSKFKIMNINKKIDIFDFAEKMQSIVNFIDGAFPKMNSLYDMPLFKLMPISKNIEPDVFSIFNINVENELEAYEENDEGAYNLIALNYKEGMPILYYTNSMFFDNTNKTLPLGMDMSTKVLIDNKKLEFLLVNKTKFRTNSYFSKDMNNPKSKDIFVYEYDVFMKDDKNGMPRNELIGNITFQNEENKQNETEDEQKLDDEQDEEILEEKENKIENSLEEKYEEDFEEDDIEEDIDDDQEENESDEEEEEEEEEDDDDDDDVAKKLLKIQQKYEKEIQKLLKREEKAKEKLKKKSKEGKK